MLLGLDVPLQAVAAVAVATGRNDRVHQRVQTDRTSQGAPNPLQQRRGNGSVQLLLLGWCEG